MFTDFTYNNLGLPKNPILPWYAEDFPDQWGFTGNPLGIGFIDEGVGLFLDGYYGAPPNQAWGQFLPFFEGKFQTSTVRNVGEVPYAGFVKAYMHNGYLLSLQEVVHFYNTRDAYPGAYVNGACRPGTVEKVNCWPPPEDPNNENMTIGKLGLTSAEENDLVAFLETLTGWLRPNGESDEHAGQHHKETCNTAGALNCNHPGFAVEPETLYLRRGDLPRLRISTVGRNAHEEFHSDFCIRDHCRLEPVGVCR